MIKDFYFIKESKIVYGEFEPIKFIQTIEIDNMLTSNTRVLVVIILMLIIIIEECFNYYRMLHFENTKLIMKIFG